MANLGAFGLVAMRQTSGLVPHPQDDRCSFSPAHFAAWTVALPAISLKCGHRSSTALCNFLCCAVLVCALQIPWLLATVVVRPGSVISITSVSLPIQ
eukprot:6197766-Pleurochrysis_carterae.AAC.1